MTNHTVLYLAAAILVAVVGSIVLFRVHRVLAVAGSLDRTDGPHLLGAEAIHAIEPIEPIQEIEQVEQIFVLDALDRLRGQLGATVSTSISRAIRDDVVPALTQLIDRPRSEPRERSSPAAVLHPVARTLRLVPAAQGDPPDAEAAVPAVGSLLTRARFLVDWAEEGTRYVTTHDVALFSEIDRRMRTGYADEALDSLLPDLRSDVAAFETRVGPGVLADELRQACDAASTGVQQYWHLWSQLRERRPIATRIVTAIDDHYRITTG